MKKSLFKKTVSAVVALAAAASLSAAVFAALPVTSEMTGRYKHFTSADSTGCYSPMGIWSDGGVVEIDDGYLTLMSTNGSSQLAWGDYLNAVYGLNNGFVTVKLEKLTATTSMYMRFWEGINTEVKWESDGKLYARYYDEPTAGTDAFSAPYRYVCDMPQSLEAIITIYFYKDSGIFSIAVDGEYKKAVMYADTSSANVTYIRFFVNPASVGDGIAVDYVKVGEITSATNSGMTGVVNTRFAGDKYFYALNSEMINFKSGVTPSDENTIYAASYKGDGEFDSVAVTASVTDTVGDCTVTTASGEFRMTDLDTGFAKIMTWNGMRPTMAAAAVTNADINAAKVSSSAPAVSTVHRNGLHWESAEGEADGVGSVEFTGSEGTAARTDKIIRAGGDGYVAAKSYCYGSYPHNDYAVMSFTLQKSNVEAEGKLQVLPCDFVRFDWNEKGKILACFRESADQQGPTAKWTEVYDAGDALSIDVTLAMNIIDSTYRMYINGECVVYDMFSRAVYADQHVLPSKVEFIRIFSESGESGEWFAITNFKSGYGPGFGA